MKQKTKTFIFYVATALAVGLLSALLTNGGANVFDQAFEPPLLPPAWLFPVVWTILFTLMGVSAAKIRLDTTAPPKQINSALSTYTLSLVVNFFWSIIFFKLKWFLFAFLWLLLLLFLIAQTITKYRKINKTAALLQLPYLLWVGFAGYLTFAIWWLNK